MNSQLTTVLRLIDAANALDPNLEPDAQGNETPKELLYSLRMSEALEQFHPNASEALQIATRAQHIERWLYPRSDYPDGRTGYKKWRSNLYLFHAKRAAEIAEEAGYSQELCQRIAHLVQKRGMKQNPEAQILEDVVCLVFLQFYFAEFATKHDEKKLIDIIQKTWKKMSNDGHQAALKINFPTDLKKLVEKALC